MKTKFTVKIDLGANHIRLMQDLNDGKTYRRYTREVEYLESRGLALAELDKKLADNMYRVSLTKLGKNILAEVESSNWTMQPGFVVTREHISILKHMISAEYMSVSTAKFLKFSEQAIEDMTGANAPFPFLCHAGVAGGWVIMKYEDDTYPNYLEEAKHQIRQWDNRVRYANFGIPTEELVERIAAAEGNEDDELSR